MMIPLIRLAATLLLIFPALPAAEITVFAAASLTDSLRKIAVDYEKETGDKVRFNFAASNTLAQQIRAGAPADLFFSADEAKMDLLETAGLIVKNSREVLLENSLVIIIPKDDPTLSSVKDLTRPAIRHLSIGDPRAVPAGIYAKAYLENAGVWEEVQPKIVPAESVRTALAVVEAGNAEAGIVYKTDAALSRRITIAVEIPAAEGPKIRYPVALLKDSRSPAAARKFLNRLAAPESAQTFREFGFSTPTP